jgi:hypothetical protein
MGTVEPIWPAGTWQQSVAGHSRACVVLSGREWFNRRSRSREQQAQAQKVDMDGCSLQCSTTD